MKCRLKSECVKHINLVFIHLNKYEEKINKIEQNLIKRNVANAEE